MFLYVFPLLLQLRCLSYVTLRVAMTLVRFVVIAIAGTAAAGCLCIMFFSFSF